MKDFGETMMYMLILIFSIIIIHNFFSTLLGWKAELLCERENNVYSCVRTYVPGVME